MQELRRHKQHVCFQILYGIHIHVYDRIRSEKKKRSLLQMIILHVDGGTHATLHYQDYYHPVEPESLLKFIDHIVIRHDMDKHIVHLIGLLILGELMEPLHLTQRYRFYHIYDA